jgi:uncharacterized SAM-dependent methyltransferase
MTFKKTNAKMPKQKFVCVVRGRLCCDYVDTGSGKGVNATVLCTCVANHSVASRSLEVHVTAAIRCVEEKNKCLANSEDKPPT